jgi:DNA-binding transcriptional LysR family regulator
MPELSALEVLLAVAEAGSLNAAARALGISQQAVSARIRAIETQTGVVLVSRTPRGSSLLPAGVVVAEWASRLLEVAAEVDAGLAALRHDRAASLRLASSLTVAEQLLPGWLVALQADATRRKRPVPEVVLTVTNSATVVRAVRDGEVDLGFVESPEAPPGLASRTVGRDRLVVVVRPAHPWVRRTTPLSPTDLARTALVAREEGSGTREALVSALRVALGDGVEIAAPTLALPSTAALRAAVMAGAGPAVLSELVVADDVAAGRLRTVEVDGLDLRREFRAIWAGGRQPPAGAARDLVALAVGA